MENVALELLQRPNKKEIFLKLSSSQSSVYCVKYSIHWSGMRKTKEAFAPYFLPPNNYYKKCACYNALYRCLAVSALYYL